MVRRTVSHGKRYRRQAQSTVEYLVMFAAVIAAGLYFMSHTFNRSYQSTMTTGTNSMMNMADRLFN